MDNSKPRHNDHLGVNKIGKNIRKSPLHQPNFSNNPTRPQPQPQVYNISKNDFRSIVQQLTGSPSRESLPRPPQNPTKPQNTRLHKIRPAPLTQINRPPLPVPPPLPVQRPVMAPPPPVQYNNSSFQLPPQQMMQPMVHNTLESPVSAYMRYLQSSFLDSAPNPNQSQPPYQAQPHVPGQREAQPPRSGSVPNTSMPAPRYPNFPSPRINGPTSYMPGLPSPRTNGPAPVMPSLPSPRNGTTPIMPNLPSPRFNATGPPMFAHPSPQGNASGTLLSPTSQFLLPSPTGYPNMFSPRSPYPVLSPGVQYPPPLTPNFSFAPFGQPGPQPPPSPGLVFPLSPSGFFTMPSPRWRDQV